MKFSNIAVAYLDVAGPSGQRPSSDYANNINDRVSCCCCRLCLYLTIILPSQPKSSYTTNNTFVLLIANTTSEGTSGPQQRGEDARWVGWYSI